MCHPSADVTILIVASCQRRKDVPVENLKLVTGNEADVKDGYEQVLEAL